VNTHTQGLRPQSQMYFLKINKLNELKFILKFFLFFYFLILTLQIFYFNLASQSLKVGSAMPSYLLLMSM
jgi:hypothetical protein